MDESLKELLRRLAERFNDPRYFTEDPIVFPRHFAAGLGGDGAAPEQQDEGGYCLQDVEIASLMAGHLAWGRRAMIVRDCRRLFAQMRWRPYEYVMQGCWRDDPVSLHRTIKWSEIAAICSRLRDIYRHAASIEGMSVAEIRTDIYGSREDKNAACKKINMIRRWLVRDDGLVDLGLWKNTDKRSLLIPLDVHVHRTAMALGLSQRRSADMKTVIEITDALKEVFPDDPCLGDFALFGAGVTAASLPQDGPAVCRGAGDKN